MYKRQGQNVRLAAKLTGWRIDIKSEDEKRKEVEAQLGALETGGDASPDAEAETPADTTDVENPAAPPDAADENA